MSLFDFNKLNRPSTRNKPTNPIEIFRSVPALAETPNDLWQGQSKALEAWDAQRAQKDVLISLHTGAGKTIVGLLAAQSLVHEGLARVLYLCATNDLVVQTSREIDNKLGFPHTTRMEGRFSNNLYSTSQGFCLTNYQALFNSRSVFRNDLRPEAVIFDDAHVAEKVIRDCFTLRVEKEKQSEIYGRLVELLRPHFVSLHKSDHFDRVVKGDSSYYVIAVPPNAVVAISRDGRLLQILRAADQDQGNIGFALGHVSDRLDRCAIFISKNSIEVSPAFLPSKRISFLSDPEIRRIYLSATLTSEVDFCRAFGRRPSSRIEPESDAGIGERLIILADQDTLVDGGAKGVKAEKIAQTLAATHKLLISTPTYLAATKYRQLGIPPRSEEFSAKLDQFRRSTAPGVFVLVGRVDGIDLPHATCRVMLADGLPAGFSLLESYLYDFLEMRNSFAAKLANRITQLFGRTNRGRNDYSVIFVTERRFVNWLLAPRNVALLPELLRKQLMLGKSLVDQFRIKDIQAFPLLAKQVIDRDTNWLAYYKDSVNGLDVGEDQRKQAAEIDKILTEAAVAEAEFGAQLWEGSVPLAREALGAVVDRVVVADRRLAGWYNIQIGHTYELEGGGEAAAKQYAQARARIYSPLALPYPATFASVATEQKPKNLFHEKLLDIFNNDIKIQNDQIKRYDRMILPLFDGEATTNQHEEALRYFGELLGFEATRPEQEADSESTLDVLWRSPAVNEAILFELKTKKGADKAINSADVGQGFNHLKWAENALKGTKALGLVFVSYAQQCSREASPSEDMWVANLGYFRALYDEVIQMLYALQRLKPLERYAEIEALCTRAEWQPGAIFARLRGVRLDLGKK
jgi:hypothetical protein